MRTKLLRRCGALALLGCVGCAYQNPAQPTAPTVDPSVPAQMTLGASPGSGTDAGTAIVTARVQNASGTAVSNVIVTFTTSRGTVSPAQVTTNGGGTATAKLTASDTADVTASAGSVSAHTLVVAAAPGNPTPAPTLALAFLNVSGSATTGKPLPFGVSSSVTGVTWFWSFGDGANEQSSAFTTTHTYTQAGTYTASVSSASTTTASATITVADSTAVPTPAPAAFVATMGCPATTTLVQACNVSVTANGVPLPSASITNVTWDWGDGQTDTNQTLPVKTHTYASSGTYMVFASVTGAPPLGTPQTATTSQSVTIP